MAINLQKGQRIEIGLQKVGVGLGWDPNEGTGFDFDLDASAFMLGENKKLPQDEYFIFYNNKLSPDGAVEAGDDDLTGGNSDGGDDETLMVDLTKVSPKVNEIVFTVTIHEWDKRKQNLGQYELDEDFSIETAVEFGRLYRKNGEWKFEAMGIGYKGGLQYFVDKYVG